MAKLRSSSCRPLVQGMMLLALLLLPSIQAAPALAIEEGVVGMLGKITPVAAGEVPLVGKMTPVAAGEHPLVGKMTPVAVENLANLFLTELAKKDGWKEFSTGARKGIKFHKKWCKAQGWMYKLGGSNFVDALAADLGRLGDLAWKLRTFSYEVTSEAGVNVCWFQEDVPAAGTRATTTLVPGMYPGRHYVRITSIRVDGVDQVKVPALTLADLIHRLPPPTAYLSTAQPYTYLESSLYGRLTDAVIGQTNALNPGPPLYPITAADKLCYAAAIRRPRIAIFLASNNVMELDNVWYRDSSISMVCLGIFPATTGQPPVLGTKIQSGKTMTIDLTAAGGLGTLTFTT